tara:strand:+ start:833 stop:1165 length:333 start_codon:yes stop_codon:yes gene_type:complete
VKGIKKNKQILFLETEKRHADLKVKLKTYGITQSEFIRGCISGLINDDEQFLPYFFKLLEEKSYIKSSKNRNKNKEMITKGLNTLKEDFTLADNEIENIFDIIEKDHPDL